MSAVVRVTFDIVILVDWVTIVMSRRSVVTSVINVLTKVTNAVEVVSVPVVAVPPIASVIFFSAISQAFLFFMTIFSCSIFS